MKASIGIFTAILLITICVIPESGIAEKVPSFTVTTTDGVERSSDDYSGKVLVIIIMFTTCSVCNGQMPIWVEEFEVKDSDVEFLSVSVDKDDTTEMLDEFQEKYGATWPIAKDDSFIGKFNAVEVPRTIFISPRGDIASEKLGYMTEEEIEDGIDDARDYEGAGIPFISLPSLLLTSFFLTLIAIVIFDRKRDRLNGKE